MAAVGWKCMGCAHPIDELLVLPCTHRFCVKCMSNWLESDCMQFVVEKKQLACWFCWTVWPIPDHGGLLAYGRSWTFEQLQRQFNGISMSSEEEQVIEHNLNNCFRSVDEAQAIARERLGQNGTKNTSDNNNLGNVFGKVKATTPSITNVNYSPTRSNYSPTSQQNNEKQNSFTNWFTPNSQTDDSSDTMNAEMTAVSSEESELKSPLQCATISNDQSNMVTETVVDLLEPTHTKTEQDLIESRYIFSSTDTYSYMQHTPICFANHFV